VRESYRTVGHAVSAEIEVRRSRFRCDVARVETEAAARALVDRSRREHWDAGHHCSAFVLGPEGSVQRSSDDGEPSGTAGAPMLEVLRGRGLSDVAVVVSRWFGGTLLGAGGLVRAYSEATRAGVDAAGTVERRRLERYDVAAGHALAGRLDSDLRARGVQVTGVDYGELATLHVAVPAGLDLGGLLAQLTAGAVRARPTGVAWSDVSLEA
jgi:uncharacterized YigZ family protein